MTRTQELRAHWPIFAMILMVVLQAVISVQGGGINTEEVFIVLLALLGAVTTYFVPSFSDRFPWAKTFVAGVTAAVTVLGTAAADGGLTTEVWLRAAVALLVGVGVVAKTEKYARDYALAT